MGASYNYEFEQASPSINAETLALIQRLYRASDTKGEGAEWADCFTEDAKIWLLGNIASGKKEFENSMNGTWDNVDHRVHKLVKGFTVGADTTEVVIEGFTESFSPNGESYGARDWLVKQRYARENGHLKISYYTIYFVATSPPY